MNIRTLLASAATMAIASASFGAFTMSPLATFGGGDGWLAPGENAFLGTGNLERGMAYNPATGNVLFVSRNAGISARVLNGTTGVETGTLNVTGVTGGSIFAGNLIGAGSDGAIYLGNLSSAASYKIYRWANEAAVPTTAVNGFTANVGTTLPRIGDTMDVIGSGAGTRIVASGSGDAGYVVASTADGVSFTVSNQVSPITGAAVGDFRLGLTFTSSDTTVLGNQNSTSMRLTTYAGDVGTLVGSPVFPLLTGNSRAMDYAVVAGKPLLAIADMGPNTDAVAGTVRVYDMTDPLNPVSLGSGRTIAGNAVANVGATGAVAWGNISGDTATLYAMLTNNGIQAFTVVVPEPTTLSAVAGLGLLMGRRRK